MSTKWTVAMVLEYAGELRSPFQDAGGQKKEAVKPESLLSAIRKAGSARSVPPGKPTLPLQSPQTRLKGRAPL